MKAQRAARIIRSGVAWERSYVRLRMPREAFDSVVVPMRLGSLSGVEVNHWRGRCEVTFKVFDGGVREDHARTLRRLTLRLRRAGFPTVPRALRAR